MFKYCRDANIIFYFFEVYSFTESFMILIWTKPTIFSPPQNTHTHRTEYYFTEKYFLEEMWKYISLKTFKYCTGENIFFYFFEVFEFIESFMVLIWTYPTISAPHPFK